MSRPEGESRVETGIIIKNETGLDSFVTVWKKKFVKRTSKKIERLWANVTRDEKR